jgi:hypothetical protein
VSHSAKSIKYFGFYLVGLGLSALLVPDLIGEVMGFESVGGAWPRVVGMVVCFLAYYYLTVAKLDARPFFKATVVARLSVPLFFVAFVAMGLERWTLICIGVPDFAGALWTWSALRKDARDEGVTPTRAA